MENGVRWDGAAGAAVPGESRYRRGRAFLIAASVVGCVALSGCAGSQRAPANDPLLGGRNPPPGVAAGPGVPPPVPAAVAPSAPTVPSSIASLASGPARPLDGGMRIGGDLPPVPDVHTNPASGWGQPVLQNPEPASGSMARSAPIPVASPPGNAGSYEQAQDVLRGRGVTWQRLETWGDKGEWKFTCSIPNKQNPAISRNYEARAKSPIEAIHAVLEKLDKEP